MSDVLEQLAQTLRARREADPKESYVASLHHKGLNKILEKVGEEATEVVLAAKDAGAGGDREAVVGEVADLWFHSMVMLSHLDIDVDEVLGCLADRFGVSGLEEKASRET
ncbi:MAG: phosphoribosyl-ATP diphosphatase [Halioglobus sp.]|nr:phosphoribosyl-ATP diphosphatase [Halioglobus sp.]